MNPKEFKPMSHAEAVEALKPEGQRVSDRPRLAGSVRKALEEAVSTIYFDDCSDYKTSLMAVVKHLDPEIYDLMVVDRRAAFKKLSEQND